MPLLTFAHVAAMFTAVAMIEGPMLFYFLAVRDRDVAGMRRLLRWGTRAESFGNVLALIGIGLGIAAGLTGGIDLLASWLVATYLIFAGAFIYGAIGGRYLKRLEAALEASPDDEPSAELMTIVRHPYLVSMNIAPPFIMGTILALMIFKPTLW